MVLREWDGTEDGNESDAFGSLYGNCGLGGDWSAALAVLGRLSELFSFQADDWDLVQVRPHMFGGMHSPSGCLIGLLATT